MSIEWGDEPVAPSPAPSEWGDTPVAAESPYSPAAIAQQRQDVVRTTAELRRLREEADAEAKRPKLNIGIRNPLTGEIAYQTEIPGPLVALVSEAIKSSPSVAAGAAAGSAVMPLANAVGSIPGPVGAVGRFGIPLVAGGLAAIGTRMAQEQVLPQILPESAQRVYDVSGQIAAENPNAALVGQFLGSAPFFRPGLPLGTTGAARLTVPLVAGGIGAGIEGAQQLAAGEFDPQKLAIAAAGQALFNRETALAAKIAPNFVLPNIRTGEVPAELATVGQIANEPRLPQPTQIVPSEFGAIADARAAAEGERLAAGQAGVSPDDLRIRRLAERMMGKTPEQKLAVLDQEVKLAGDTLTPAEQRGALDLKQELQRQIEQQKALEEAANAQQTALDDAQALQEKQAKAVADIQKAQAQDAANAAKMQEEAAKPPEIPKSTQILAEQAQPKAIANVATEIGTQTSPFAVQAKINELTAPPPAPEQIAPVAPGVPQIAESPSSINIKPLDEAAVQSAPFEGRKPAMDLSTPTGFKIPSPEQAKKAQTRAAVKNAADYQYTVFRPGEGIPDAIQVDAIGPNGEALGSSNVSDLNKAGAKLPEVPAWVPQGKYTLEQMNALIKQGEPTNATQTRQQPENNQLQRPRTPQGSAVSENGGEVRQGEGEQAGGGNRPVGSPEVNAGNEVRQEPLQESLTPPAQMKRPELRAELSEAGVKEVAGLPLEEANAAQLMNAVGRLRRGQFIYDPKDIIEVLQSKKRLPKRSGQIHSAGPDLLYDAAHDAALDVAILGIRAGRTIAEIIQMALAKFRAMHPKATAEELAALEQDIRDAHTGPTPTPSEAEALMASAPTLSVEGGRPAEATQAASRMRQTRGAITVPGKQTETPAFKKWFGESKVVDAEGRPLVVYKAMYPKDYNHPALADITEINRPTEFPAFNKGEKGVKIAGFFGDIPTANRFAESAGTGQAIFPTYLSLKKPFVIEANGRFSGDVQFGESGKEFRDAIRSGKYDGVIIKNTKDEGTVYVALEPTQIKSAIGNRGTFDPNDPDIRAFINPRAALALGGAPVGGAAAFYATDQEAGESDEAYRARLLRNTLLGAAGGAAAGFGIGAMAQGARAFPSRSPKRAPPSKEIPLPIPGEGQGIRQTAEKVIENRQYPEKLRETLANDPDIIYDKFALSELADRVTGATEPELKAMLTSPNIRERLGATAELANRYSVSKDPALEAEGARLYSELAQNLTNPAQMLGLGKLVKTPQGYVTALNTALKKVDRVLSGAQEAELKRLAEESIRSDQRLAATSRAAQEDFSSANEQAYRQAKAENAKAQKAMDDYVHRVAPEAWDTILSKIIQGGLLTSRSIIQNPVGNSLFQPIFRPARAISSALDEIFSGLTGKPRTLSELNPIPTKAEAEAFGEGIKIAAKELLTGPGEDSYVKAEIQRGFKPLRSLAQAFTGKDIAVRPDGTISVSDRLKKLTEGTFGAVPEAMFRFLSLGDKPFRRSEEMRVLLAQARLKGLKGRDLIKFIEFPDAHTQSLIETEGRHAIFAQENAGVRKLNQFLDSGVAEMLGVDKIPFLRGAIKVFFRTQVPYRQFPVNFITTAFNFAVPELAFGRAIYHGGLSRAFGVAPDRRKAFIAIGEGVMGTMMYGAANYLWSNGLISEPADKDAKQRSVQYEQMGPARINISGLGRAMTGGDPHWKSGDTTIDWSGMGVPAFVFHIFTVNAARGRQETARTGENRQRIFEPGQYLRDRIASFPGVTEFALDQSFLSGTSAFLDALRDWDQFGDRWTQNTFRAISSIAVPNLVESYARTQSKYIPELRGDNLGETLNNVWKFKTLQLTGDERHNLKRDLWGQPILRTPDGKNPYIDQFLDVSKSSAKTNEPFKQALIDLYRTTESPDVYPPLPSRNIGVEGIMVKLTPDDYDKYQRFVGEARRNFAQMVVSNPNFQASITLPEAKILALQEAYNEGAKVGKQQLLAEPGVVQKYFPDLVGFPPAAPEASRVISRDVKARGRLRMQQENEFGDDPAGP